MRDMRSMGKLAAAATSLLLLSSGCGGEPVESAEEFAAGIRLGYDVDYEPMRAPANALQQAQLIVRGTLVDIFDGIEIEYPDSAMTERAANTYATFQVTVNEVLYGDESLVTEGSVYVQVAKSPTVSAGELADSNPRPAVLAFVISLEHWRPHEEASVRRPDRLPDGAAILYANPDGFWMETDNDDEVVGIHASRFELDPAWGDPQTLDDFASVIIRCREGDCPESAIP